MLVLADLVDAGIGGGIAAVITALAAAIVLYQDRRQGRQIKGEKVTNDEYRRIVKDYDKRLDKLEKREKSLEKQVQSLRRDALRWARRVDRYKMRLESYENALKQAGIPFQPFVEQEEDLFGPEEECESESTPSANKRKEGER